MLKLDQKLIFDEKTIGATNLCDAFDKADLDRIGDACVEGYNQDKQSRAVWEKRSEAAMKLAMQVQETKTFPWPSASNVKFPLVTIASMQFHSRAYPALVPGRDIVKQDVIKPDPTGELTTLAKRVGCHMSWQVTYEDRPWKSQHDRLLINLPIVGTAFKKSYYSNSKGHNVSELVLAQDLVLNYYAKSVEDCERKTHVVPLSRNTIHERVMRGAYRDILEEPWFTDAPPPQQTQQQIDEDRRKGVQPPMADSTTPWVMLEQHVLLDLDGDGYAEPYVVTVEQSSRQVVRIVARCDNDADVERTKSGKIIQVKATEFFTKYGFIPSPDNSIYEVGFGTLLGPLNESVNTAINQLFDAGTMATTAGGFLGRGAKIRGGTYTFAPLEWKRVDSTGDDLQKSIMPLPVREPSAVLFNLLSLLINYTNRISGSTDAIVGENPGQNTPAYNQQSMIEQGMKIYNALFKRCWESMTDEFTKLYVLNGTYLDSQVNFGPDAAIAYREDYLHSPQDIRPTADPEAVSDQERLQKAAMVKASAAQTPGYDVDAVERWFLEQNKIPAIDILFPGSDKVPQAPHPKVQVEQMKRQIASMKVEADFRKFVMKLALENQKIQAQIDNLKAQSVLYLQQAGAEHAGTVIQAFEAQIGALQQHQAGVRELMQMSIDKDNADADRASDGAGSTGMEAPPGQQGAVLGSA